MVVVRGLQARLIMSSCTSSSYSSIWDWLDCWLLVDDRRLRVVECLEVLRDRAGVFPDFLAFFFFFFFVTGWASAACESAGFWSVGLQRCLCSS